MPGLSKAVNILLRLDTSGFEAGLDRSIKNIDRFAKRLESVGRDLTTRLTIPLGAAGVAAVATFAKFDKLEKGLTAITGSTEAAQKRLKALLEVVKDTRTTLDLQTAVTAQLQLQGVGVEAEKATETIKQLGIAVTVAGASSEDLGEVARQLAQAAAKGEIFQEELSVILERIPSLAQVIKDEFGTVTAEGLREAGVSAQEFIDRLTVAIAKNERFQSVQGGLSKAIETFGIELQIAGAELGKTIAQSIDLEGILTKVSAVISKLVEGFSNLDAGTKRVIVVTAGLAAAIGPVLVAIGSIVRIMPIAVAGLQSFGFAAAAATGVVAGLAFAFFKLSDEFGSTDQAIAFIEAKFAKLSATVSEVITIIKESFTDLGSAVVAALKGDFSGAADLLVGEVGNIGKRIADAGNEAFEQSLRKSALKSFAKEFNAQGSINAPDIVGQIQSALANAENAFSGVNAQTSALVDNTNKVRENIASLSQLDSLPLVGSQVESLTGHTQALTDIQEIQNERNARWNELLTEQAERLESIGLSFDAISGRAMPSFSDAVLQGFDVFRLSVQNGVENIKDLAGAVFKASVSIIKNLIQQGVAAAVANALKNPAGIIPPLGIALAGAAGAAAAGLFSGLVKAVAPKFAEGGLVFGPTLGIIGEGVGTTRSNPEIIAPLDKLKGFMKGGNGGYIAETRISASDLIILIRDEEDRQNRIR